MDQLKCRCGWDANCENPKCDNCIEVDRWIGVTQELPPKRVEILTVDIDGYITVARVTRLPKKETSKGLVQDEDYNTIIHWMHLPRPPSGMCRKPHKSMISIEREDIPD